MEAEISRHRKRVSWLPTYTVDMKHFTVLLRGPPRVDLKWTGSSNDHPLSIAAKIIKICLVYWQNQLWQKMKILGSKRRLKEWRFRLSEIWMLNFRSQLTKKCSTENFTIAHGLICTNFGPTNRSTRADFSQHFRTKMQHSHIRGWAEITTPTKQELQECHSDSSS